MTTTIAPTADAEFDAPASVLHQARSMRAVADRAEAQILVLACEWADLHPHITPHGRGNGTGGSTCDCNLAPLCRRHHRMKTHTRWRYDTIEPGVHLWTAPHRHHYLVDHTGTTTVTPTPPPGSGPRPRPRHDGCHQPDG